MNPMIDYPVDGDTARGYLANPQAGEGPGVIVLHAWWGLNDFFKSLCDRLARVGYVVFAPDLYAGSIANTVEEAQQLLDRLDPAETQARLLGAVRYLRSRVTEDHKGLGVVGFSLGGSWALWLSCNRPEDISAVVVFYGSDVADFAQSKAAYQGHFAEIDEWEPLENVRQMEAGLREAGREVSFHFYPNAGHWFFEDNRAGSYDSEAAQQAWSRMLEFLHQHLGPGQPASAGSLSPDG